MSRRRGRILINRVRASLIAALAVANLGGIIIIAVCIVWVLPSAPIHRFGQVAALNGILGGVYLLVVVPIAVVWAERWVKGGRTWLEEGREPTEREVTAVLRTPWRIFLVHATMWLAAATCFSILNGIVEFELFPRVVFTITLGGLTTSAVAYLLTERITRPLAAAALSVHGIPDTKLPGVTTRTLLVWILGTGVPLLGLAIAGLFALIEDEATPAQLAVTMLVLASTGLIIGGTSTVLGVRAVADPVASLRKGLRAVAAGDLDWRVPVYDGSVLGHLQAGFNEMAQGLAERERLRDLYGRQVGHAVAAASMERGTELGGELREVAVLFVDVVGSTDLAVDRSPETVVELLNRFFAVVVDEVDRHGGWVNKFQGDATLAVFGAPTELDDPAGRCLAAARSIAARLPVAVPELGAGVGASYGTVVAGHVGDERRFEYTVIGDPVNEAARLTEVAKRHRPMVIAAARAVAAACEQERACWEVFDEEELRGRSRPTALARPISRPR